MVEMTGIEPTTSAMRMPRSSQLSYIPSSGFTPLPRFDYDKSFGLMLYPSSQFYKQLCLACKIVE